MRIGKISIMDEDAELFGRRITDVGEKEVYLQRKNQLLKELSHIPESQKADIILKLEDDLAMIANKFAQSEKTDRLTGAINKQGFESALDGSITMFNAKGIKFSVLYLDLADFKKINDSYGHGVGDEALKEAKRVLSTAIRDYDILARNEDEAKGEDKEEIDDQESTSHIARVGGDEFLVLLQGADEEGAKVVTDRILDTLAKEKEKLGPDHIINKINFNYGFEEWKPGKSTEQFMEEAEKRMYEQKRGNIGQRE